MDKEERSTLCDKMILVKLKGHTVVRPAMKYESKCWILDRKVITTKDE